MHISEREKNDNPHSPLYTPRGCPKEFPPPSHVYPIRFHFLFICSYIEERKLPPFHFFAIFLAGGRWAIQPFCSLDMNLGWDINKNNHNISPDFTFAMLAKLALYFRKMKKNH